MSPASSGWVIKPRARTDTRTYMPERPGESEQGGTPHIGAVGGPRGVDAGALDADEDPERDQHRALDLLDHRPQALASGPGLTPEVEVELVPVEGHHADEHEEEEGDQLGDCGHDVDEGGLLDAVQHQAVDEPEADRGANDRGRVVTPAEDGKK